MDRASIAAIVDKALNELIDDQPELLDLGVTERALSHHLANYIAGRTLYGSVPLPLYGSTSVTRPFYCSSLDQSTKYNGA